MRLVLMHIDDEPYSLDEDASFIVPGGEREVVIVPLRVLEQFVPELLQSMENLPEQCCDACGESLARLPPADMRIS